MIFDEENLQIQLLGVFDYYDEKAVSMKVGARPFCALSLRLDSDAQVVLKKETIALKTRDLAFFPANTPYERQATHDRMIGFHFNIANLAARDFAVLHHVPYETLLPLFEAALREWRSRMPGYRYRSAALLYQIFGQIRTALGTRSKPFTPSTQAALATIASDFANPALSVAQLAAAAHMSDTWFRKQFAREVGATPKKYLTGLRLEYAQSLLNVGCDTVAEIAEKSGFRDAKNFATAFKKQFGYPPSAHIHLE